MQDNSSPSSVPSQGPATTEPVELTPLDEVAIAATSTLAADHQPARAVPGKGHKMEILDNAIDALNSAASPESPLVKTVKDWIDKAAAFAHVAVDKTASTVVPLAQTAAQAKDDAVAKAQDYKASASVATEVWVEDAKSAIRERPLTAIGIALLSGVVISLIAFPGSDSDADSQD